MFDLFLGKMTFPFVLYTNHKKWAIFGLTCKDKRSRDFVTVGPIFIFFFFFKDAHNSKEKSQRAARRHPYAFLNNRNNRGGGGGHNAPPALLGLKGYNILALLGLKWYYILVSCNGVNNYQNRLHIISV